MPVSERDREQNLCPVCGMWQSDAETDPEQRARINAAFAGVKSGQLAEVREALREAIRLARDFNRGAMTWQEYDRLLVRWEGIANA